MEKRMGGSPGMHGGYHKLPEKQREAKAVENLCCSVGSLSSLALVYMAKI